MPSPLIGITGATGEVGGRVAHLLDARAVPVRLLARDPASPRLPVLERTFEVGTVDYGDPASVDALQGVRTLLMVSAAEDEHRLDQHRAFVDAAVAAGVEHVVYTSFAAAAPDAVFTLGRDHWATEEHLRASGMSWTFLRDNFYSDLMEAFVGDDDVLRGPAGQGRCALVARDDVAAVAAAVLADPDAHVGHSYELSGPQALTMAEVTGTISRMRGRDVRFVDETLPEAYASRASYGAPDWQVEAWVSTYAAIASGVLARVTGDVEAVTGHPATSLEQVLLATA